MGCSPPPYVASPKVDPRLDSRGGTMHIRDRCRGAVGDCWRKVGLIWPTRGSAKPKWRSPRPAFLWSADRWALVLILGCILLVVPISSSLLALLVSETQLQDICAFLLCSLVFSSFYRCGCLQMIIHQNSWNSISHKPYN